MSRNRYMLAGICLTVCCLGCRRMGIAEQEQTERGSQLYRKAFDAEQSGDLQEAIRLYNRLLIEEPRSYSAHFQLATLLQDHAEDYIGAIHHYRRYLDLRPETEKETLARDRIRIAEQLLAPQILRKVGDSVQGLTQAHLLAENDRLNRLITTLEGEKSRLTEALQSGEKERLTLQNDHRRLRDILQKMRVAEVDVGTTDNAAKAAAAARGNGEAADAGSMTPEQVKRLREEAQALSRSATKPGPIPRPVIDAAAGESMLQRVRARLTGSDRATEAHDDPEPGSSRTSAQDRPDADAEIRRPVAEPGAGGAVPNRDTLSKLNPFDRGGKRGRREGSGAPRTYVVQPGDTLFRVAEQFYGDPTKWKRIREANRTRIDPDGRIRAGQIITVP